MPITTVHLLKHGLSVHEAIFRIPRLNAQYRQYGRYLKAGLLGPNLGRKSNPSDNSAMAKFEIAWIGSSDLQDTQAIATTKMDGCYGNVGMLNAPRIDQRALRQDIPCARNLCCRSIHGRNQLRVGHGRIATNCRAPSAVTKYC